VILCVDKRDGSRREIALQAERGDGLSLEVEPGGIVEPLPLAELAGLELDAHDVTPTLTLTLANGTMRVLACWPESCVHVGFEDPAAGLIGVHPGRHEVFRVGELAAVSLDRDRMTATS
jgi:hypothetical protein